MRQLHSICSQYVRSHDPDDKCAGLPIRPWRQVQPIQGDALARKSEAITGAPSSFLTPFTFAFARNPDLRTHPNQVPERA